MKVSACPAVQEHISRKAARMREHRLDFPVSPCPYPAGSASLKRAIFVRNCRTHGKMRAGWSGVLGYYTIIGFLIRRVYTKTLRIY